MAGELKHSVKKNLAGAYTVKFDCPKCGVRLSEGLKKAGTQDVCPECGAGFVTPGTNALAKLNAQQEKLEAERAAQQAAAEEAREHARTEKEARRAEKEREKAEAARIQQAYEPAEVEPEFLEPKPSTTQRRYPVLWFYRSLLFASGYAIMILGFAIVVLSFIASVRDNEPGPFFTGIVAFLWCLGSGGAMAIMAELITVFLDIEANTRRAEPRTD